MRDFDPDLGDVVVLTSSIPKWARDENRRGIFATFLCSLVQSTGITKEMTYDKIGWFEADEISVHMGRVIIVFVLGREPEPEVEGELNLDNLLGEDDGSDHSPQV